MSPRAPEPQSPRAPEPQSPRQIWRATVKFTGQDLNNGYCQGAILLRSDTGDQCEVYLGARIEPPVRVIPEKLVFGPARPNESCVRVARIVVQKRAGIAQVKARGGGDSLDLTVRKLNGGVWELKATLVVPRDGQAADGEILLSFPGASLADVTLPYSFFNPSAVY